MSQFREILEKVASRLKIDGGSGGIQYALDRLRWPFGQREIEEMMTVLEKLKSTFLLALANDHVRLSMEIRESIEQVHEQVKSMQSDLFASLTALSPRQEAIVR